MTWPGTIQCPGVGFLPFIIIISSGSSIAYYYLLLPTHAIQPSHGQVIGRYSRAEASVQAARNSIFNKLDDWAKEMSPNLTKYGTYLFDV